MLWFLNRTQAQRRQAYKELREAGYSAKIAYRVRDWRPSKIKGVLKNRPKIL